MLRPCWGSVRSRSSMIAEEKTCSLCMKVPESLTLGNSSIICESYPLFVKRWILVLQREVNISAMTF